LFRLNIRWGSRCWRVRVFFWVFWRWWRVNFDCCFFWDIILFCFLRFILGLCSDRKGWGMNRRKGLWYGRWIHWVKRYYRLCCPVDLPSFRDLMLRWNIYPVYLGGGGVSDKISFDGPGL